MANSAVLKKKVSEYMQKVDEVITNGKYKDTWESLFNYPVAKWYQDAKFGIFIHWGVYSVPAFGSEWYPREMYRKDTEAFNHHIETYGTHDKFGYKDFIPMFRGEKFDADEWLDLFAESGAKYVMPVAEHHDGFKLYGSGLNRWNSVNMGPCRDIVGELRAACEKRGIKLCCSNHRAEHYFYHNGGLEYPSDVSSGEYDDFYGPPHMTESKGPYQENPSAEHCEEWLATNCEMIDLYQPKVVWFDWWIQNLAWKPYLKKFAAYYYNRAIEWGEEVAINYKYDAYAYSSAVYDIERGQLSDMYGRLWQNDTAIGKKSWGYIKNNDFKKASDLTGDLVDIISKNGCLLLNVGPKPDGTITDEETAVLKDIGKWLKINGEAVYDTAVWKIYGEGPTEIPEGAFSDTRRAGYTSEDIRFTCKAFDLYAFILKADNLSCANIKSLGKKYKRLDTVIQKASILGHDNISVSFEQKDECLELKFSQALTSEHPVCVKLRLA